jgi:hypothetical protein
MIYKTYDCLRKNVNAKIRKEMATKRKFTGKVQQDETAWMCISLSFVYDAPDEHNDNFFQTAEKRTFWVFAIIQAEEDGDAFIWCIPDRSY